MTSFQKTVKYLATALALFLAIGIIVSVFNFLVSLDLITNDEKEFTSNPSYNVSNSINELDINLSSADFDIVVSNDFKVITNNDNFKIEEDFDKLTVSEENSFWKFNFDKKQIRLHIPADIYFEKVDISTSAGEVDIENITADRIKFELGAGDVTINDITVFDKADINGGAGKISVNNGIITDLDFNMGVGEMNLTSQLNGTCVFDQGIGNADITLSGSAEDYSIHVNSGIGETLIDGEKIKDNRVYGFGDSIIKLDCGIGNAKVNFSEK